MFKACLGRSLGSHSGQFSETHQRMRSEKAKVQLNGILFSYHVWSPRFNPQKRTHVHAHAHTDVHLRKEKEKLELLI